MKNPPRRRVCLAISAKWIAEHSASGELVPSGEEARSQNQAS